MRALRADIVRLTERVLRAEAALDAERRVSQQYAELASALREHEELMRSVILSLLALVHKEPGGEAAASGGSDAVFGAVAEAGLEAAKAAAAEDHGVAAPAADPGFLARLEEIYGAGLARPPVPGVSSDGDEVSDQ